MVKALARPLLGARPSRQGGRSATLALSGSVRQRRRAIHWRSMFGRGQIDQGSKRRVNSARGVVDSHARRLGLLVVCGVMACALVPARAEARASGQQIVAQVAEQNLVANPSVELSTGGAPDGWTSESWGANTASFGYVDDGHTGDHSVQTTVTDYASGDSKWMFDPVPVEAGSQYTYEDWYRSSANTDVWAQFTLSDGTLSYDWLGGVGASADWAPAVEKFTAPSGATSVRVMHVLAADGQLTLDDAQLARTPVCTTSQATGIFNGGFEQTCPDAPTSPANWHHETYGDPAATVDYTTQAHSGARAARTTVSAGGGEAGWQSDWQGADGGQRYALRFWQNGSTYAYAYVTVRLTSGDLQYISLMSVPATQDTGWSEYDDRFVTPADTAEIQVTIASSGAGTFTLDDVAIDTLADQQPADFDQGVVSVTFDDGDASTYANGLPVLQQRNMKGTFYINAGVLGTSGFMSADDVKALADDGQQIGSHLYQHVDAVTLTDGELRQQITANTAALQDILGSGHAITDLATPYGSYTSSEVDIFMQYYSSHRTTDGLLNSKADLNARHLHAVLVTSSTSLADVESWIERARDAHMWLVLVYHAIGDSPLGGDGDGYAVTPSQFTSQMDALAASGVTTLPVNQALQLLSPQL